LHEKEQKDEPFGELIFGERKTVARPLGGFLLGEMSFCSLPGLCDEKLSVRQPPSVHTHIARIAPHIKMIKKQNLIIGESKQTVVVASDTDCWLSAFITGLWHISLTCVPSELHSLPGIFSHGTCEHELRSKTLSRITRSACAYAHVFCALTGEPSPIKKHSASMHRTVNG
jgi:hypothetical protein